MSKFFKQQNTGFTIVETLVAISIFTVSILAMMSVLASSIADTNYAKQKMTATYLAQEGIEHTRNMRDTSVLFDAISRQHGWDAFKGTDMSYTSNVIGFTRTISMTKPDGSPCGCNGLDEVKITSDVSWTQASGTYHIVFSENLFNWVE